MGTIKFSIIIPSYNTEPYIKQCIESVLHQTYTNYELIIVDDGSDDSTYEIEKKYAELTSNIKLIQINHRGVSVARNIGIENAQGDYVVFIDSDDYIDVNSLDVFYKLIEKNKPDALVGEFYCFTDDKNIPILESEKLNSRKINNQPVEKVFNYFYLKRLVYSVWRFVFKLDIIKLNNLKMKEGIIHEDEEFIPQVLLNCKSFYKIPIRHYYYRKRPNSIMSTEMDYFNYHCMLQISNDLLFLAEQQTEEYKKLLLLRDSYKMAAQCYWGIRSKAKPHLGLKFYKKHK